MDRSRLLAAGLALLSGAACVYFGLGIARTIGEFHKNHPREIYAFKTIGEPAFTFGGIPVTLTNDLAIPDQPYLVVKYGEDDLRLRVTVPGDYRLPKLIPHNDWMRVLAFAPAVNKTEREFLDDLTRNNDYRLVIVTRTPRPGVDPKTFGAAWQRDWSFDFHEFVRGHEGRGGGFTHERLEYPTTSGNKPPKPGELRENTWQFQAALQLMPKAGGVGPTHNFYGDALAAAGWRLPAAAFSGAIGTFAIAFAFAPRRVTADA
ncbi:MAG: hypothetical protein HBSAPP03_18270 [Phycisphaerae bacterium]|nr:MAG: hypothetical protein HBSAPP03_18270 [Phycisphaerae bacterium]